MTSLGYVKAFGVSYAGTIPKIKKSPEQLQPLFEAFTNSLEAIKLAKTDFKDNFICIKLNFRNNLFSEEKREFDFDSIVIEDSGIGFNTTEFERIENLNDTSKAFFNKGSGRVQFLHYFDKSEYKSIYKDDTSRTGFREIDFVLSKSDAFLKQNAIIRIDSFNEIAADNPKTILTFKTPLSTKDLDFFKQLTVAEIKEKIVTRYVAFLCENRDVLPRITLQYYLNDQLKNEENIDASDIPDLDQEKDIQVSYSKIASDGKTLELSSKVESFNLKAFKINKEKLKKNALKLTSKGEIAQEIKLESLLPDDSIDDKRYLFLLSGNYINNKDGDTRGKLNIPTLEDFKKSYGDSDSLFDHEEVLFEDIQEKANSTVLLLYDEIVKRNEEKQKEIEKLKKMFLLNPESIAEAKIKLNDSEDRILEKVYQADAKIIAQKDAEIKKRVDALNQLNPASKNFEQQFQKEIEELSKAIPLQNRASLTHYIARRKLILELFNKVLSRQLDIQQASERKFDEKLLHNLLFQQGSDEAEKSDLWIINEDFIYFKGTSESRLCDVEIDGQKIFKPKFSEEEEKYLTSLGENRKIKKPDVLLFPEEGKAIIIEFKDPEVNASTHLTQIDYYASLIRNFTIDEIQITTFYGYLIGENLDARDIRGRVSNYEYSYHFDYLFRPSQKVVGDLGDTIRQDGSIYSEVIKYSTLILRAERRNKIFLEKL